MGPDFWNQRYLSKELIWTAEANRFLIEECAGLTPGRALDLGAGEGRNAVWLAEQGWQVVAADFSDVGLDKGRQLARARDVTVSWQVQDVTTWRPPIARFELVALLYLHLPAEPMAQVLCAAAEALAPGGTLLLVGHSRDNIEHGHGGPQEPTILYQPEDITASLPELKIERAAVVQRPVQTEHGLVHALDTLVRVRRP